VAQFVLVLLQPLLLLLHLPAHLLGGGPQGGDLAAPGVAGLAELLDGLLVLLGLHLQVLHLLAYLVEGLVGVLRLLPHPVKLFLQPGVGFLQQGLGLHGGGVVEGHRGGARPQGLEGAVLGVLGLPHVRQGALQLTRLSLLGLQLLLGGNKFLCGIFSFLGHFGHLRPGLLQGLCVGRHLAIDGLHLRLRRGLHFLLLLLHSLHHVLQLGGLCLGLLNLSAAPLYPLLQLDLGLLMGLEHGLKLPHPDLQLLHPAPRLLRLPAPPGELPPVLLALGHPGRRLGPPLRRLSAQPPHLLPGGAELLDPLPELLLEAPGLSGRRLALRHAHRQRGQPVVGRGELSVLVEVVGALRLHVALQVLDGGGLLLQPAPLLLHLLLPPRHLLQQLGLDPPILHLGD